MKWFIPVLTTFPHFLNLRRLGHVCPPALTLARLPRPAVAASSAGRFEAATGAACAHGALGAPWKLGI
jgi:hypothetical protein